MTNNRGLTHNGQSVTGTSSSLMGTVIATQANYYRVKLDTIPERVRSGDEEPDTEAAKVLLCTRRARLKKVNQAVMVGDRVSIEEPDWLDRRGAIAEVMERRTELDRPPIANADQVMLLFALAQPDPDPMQMSRFLVKAESTQMSIFIGLNKSDLVSSEVTQRWSDRLQSWGYVAIPLSLKEHSSFESFYHRLCHHVTVVSGPSGAGKSSLLNALIPAINLLVGDVSGKLGRGRHTTRHVELFNLPSGGLLADTPGFNQPDINLLPEELAQCFPEIRERLASNACQFSNCLHKDEPHCVVRGEWERYPHYLKFLDEAIAYQTRLQHRSDDESGYKIKIGEAGEHRLEPKLETKRYRKPSRRSQHQDLKSLCGDVDDLMAQRDE
jgi:ribosome biogenesis GTPase